MKSHACIAILLVLALTACGEKPDVVPVQTAPSVPEINITSPVEGATLNITAVNKVDYSIKLSGAGDHAHIYMDDRRMGMLRNMQGSFTIDYLDPGKREICIKIVGGNHMPIDAGKCVTVMAVE